jgi:hypothetical protein
MICKHVKKEIHEQGYQYCYGCEKITLHIPKLDAVKQGNRVCDKCTKENRYA